jgi:putative zinc finger/helix-turn-helix YgiT family protein
MLPEETKLTKRPPISAERPFPRQCYTCAKSEVILNTISYEIEVRHDGTLHALKIPELELPVCQACGEKYFTIDVDEQINAALRAHLKLLTPDQIRGAIQRLNISQKEAAERMGIAEETLSRWLNEAQIQSRSMDNLMRVFFAFPQVRAALGNETRDAQLGIVDVIDPMQPQVSNLVK